MEPLIIAIIGAPGVGKTFLAEKLAEYLKAEKIIESVEDIPKKIIENFKKNIGQMETIVWFRNKCIKDMKIALEFKKQNKTVIVDTYLVSNELHITTMTSGFEQEILLEQAESDRKYMPQPDEVIFLDASEEKIRELTKERGRDFDNNEEFIERNLSIRKAHLDFYNQNKDSLIYLNRDGLDFNNEEDLKKVVEKIEEFTKLNN